MAMHVKKLSEEVLVAEDRIVKVGQQDVAVLKEGARTTERRRIRLCAHKTTDDTLHEMIIVHPQGAYVRPHKHLGKVESVHVIEGSVDVVVFDETGDIVEVIRLGDYSSGRRFYYRMPEACFHTLLIRSEWLVFHEITNGPFKKSDTVFPPWAPEEKAALAAGGFMQRIAQSVEALPASRMSS